MQVHEIPSYEEFFGLVDNELTDEDFSSDNKDENIQKMIAIVLSLLQEFYLLHMYDNEYYIASEVFEEELNEFNGFLKENLLVLFKEYFEQLQADFDAEYVIPAGTVDNAFDYENVINSGVDSVTDTLYADLKNKADFYKDVAVVTGVFSLHSNFRRAVRKLKNTIDYNAQYAHNRVKREYQSFVYGQEALFYWRTAGINTCAWCYEIEAMGAMPLSWFPVDHPNGYCTLVPANPNEYSDEYNELRGW